MQEKKLFIFDVDWTVIRPRSGKTFPENVHDWEWMKGRNQKLRELWNEQKKLVAFATNKGSAIWREATGEVKYPSAKEIATAMRQQIFRSGIYGPVLAPPWYVSLYDQRAVDLINQHIDQEIFTVSDMAGHSADNQAPPMYEEPEEILDRLCKEMKSILDGNVYIGIDPSWRKPEPGILLTAMKDLEVTPAETIYIGDRPEDELAALAACVDFIWTKDFFGDK